jgi:FtsH-binding integral membrane protein
MYATYTKTDFTGYGPLLLVLLSAVLFTTIAFIMVPLPDPYNYVISIVFIMVFSLCLISDIQKIVGGRHRKFKFEIDDWVFAALNVYLDIINIFLNMLQSTNSTSN